MDNVLDQFAELAWEYRDYALRGGQHYFTNVSDTIKELHSGMSKAYTCGAGLGMLGVGTSGDIGACHRFVDSPVAQMGNVMNGGVDHDARRDFLGNITSARGPDCHTCWVRPVCAGGCYHEAYINHGNTAASLLNDLRSYPWLDRPLSSYLWGNRYANPKFLERFDD